MKRFITLMLSLLLVLSLAACSSTDGGKAPEAKKNHIGETEFLVPDEVTSKRSTGSETVNGDETTKYDYMIVYTYESVSDAVIAYGEFTEYLSQNFTKQRDSQGFVLGLSNPGYNESNQIRVSIRKGITISDDLKKELTGKYLLVEMGEYTEALKKMWEEKSYYQYIEITEDDKAVVYIFQDGKKSEQQEFDLYTFMEEESLTYETGKFTIQRAERTLVYEKTTEIPD